jgi:hypothetical protein
MIRPFTESSKSQKASIAILARLAVRYASADGYAIYTLEHSSGALIPQSSDGKVRPAPEDLTMDVSTTQRDGAVIRCYPLRVEGSVVGAIAFSFLGLSLAEEKVEILDRLAKSIETLYCLPYVAAQLFEKVNALETEIVASKVFSRGQGLLTAEVDSETIALTERHVSTVLRSSRIWNALGTLLREAEEELKQREITERAKALLQEVHGMSEEEAHHSSASIAAVTAFRCSILRMLFWPALTREPTEAAFARRICSAGREARGFRVVAVLDIAAAFGGELAGGR